MPRRKSPSRLTRRRSRKRKSELYVAFVIPLIVISVALILSLPTFYTLLLLFVVVVVVNARKRWLRVQDIAPTYKWIMRTSRRLAATIRTHQEKRRSAREFRRETNKFQREWDKLKQDGVDFNLEWDKAPEHK
jgi:uncharacterized membrane protein YoaK (UPF0700 family)